jgi:hypothetical protein
MHLYQHCDKTDHISDEVYYDDSVCYISAFERPGGIGKEKEQHTKGLYAPTSPPSYLEKRGSRIGRTRYMSLLLSPKLGRQEGRRFGCMFFLLGSGGGGVEEAG